MLFADRADAGRQLAVHLEHLRGRDLVVLALPRGGVPVAYEVARALDAPLDVVVIRKLGAPFNSEFAIGAIGEGVRVVDEAALRQFGITERQLADIEAREQAELQRRIQRFRGSLGSTAESVNTENPNTGRLDLAGRVGVIVDDGIATGSTALAACRVVRALGASEVVLAVPVAPPGWTDRFGEAADEYVCLHTPRGFFAVGQWYNDFTQTTDDEVITLLAAR
ncbi:MAG: phosphoribosyltransferase [Terrimesophilobacter sp.]